LSRIATAPIRTDVATLGDYRSRALLDDQRQATSHHTPESPAAELELPPTHSHAGQSPTDPSPLDETGSAFAAAIVAERLPAPPTTPREVLLRSSRVWAPPDSDLHLTDRIA
jgi:hypothetical protein